MLPSLYVMVGGATHAIPGRVVRHNLSSAIDADANEGFGGYDSDHSNSDYEQMLVQEEELYGGQTPVQEPTAHELIDFLREIQTKFMRQDENTLNELIKNLYDKAPTYEKAEQIANDLVSIVKPLLREDFDESFDKTKDFFESRVQNMDEMEHRGDYDFYIHREFAPSWLRAHMHLSSSNDDEDGDEEDGSGDGGA
tara:strand:+ start:675 stop:1262 length:588 start_codon:yes stop_codon:yes gene_type:complete